MHVAERITGAFGSTQCPGCDKWVVPVGETCPNCDFPLSRFHSRMRWFPVLLTGLVMLVLSAVSFLFLFLPHGDLNSWVGLIWLLFAAASATVFGSGAYGVITGGRHKAGQSITSSAWKGGKKVRLEDEKPRGGR
jgi:hypothetical protein